MSEKKLNHINQNKQEVIRVDSLELFLETINKLLKYNCYIFRGMNNPAEKYPKIVRYKNNNLERETHLFEEFEKYYGLYNMAKDCWDFIALAQHHGLETRLIDFSKNPFVATFFSLYNQSDFEHVVYVANKENYRNVKNINFVAVDGNFYGGLSELSFTQKTKHNYSILFSKNIVALLEPNYANKRIFAQQGLFLIPPFVEANKIDNIYDDMPIKIIISNSIRNEILEYLSNNGFDEFHLMPDLSSACFEINRITK